MFMLWNFLGNLAAQVLYVVLLIIASLVGIAICIAFPFLIMVILLVLFVFHRE
jgi:hypothetical protein